MRHKEDHHDMLWWQITLAILGCIAAMMPITQSLQDSRWDASDSGQREQISYRRAALAKAIVLSVLVGQVAVAALSDSDSKAASREREGRRPSNYVSTQDSRRRKSTNANPMRPP